MPCHWPRPVPACAWRWRAAHAKACCGRRTFRCRRCARSARPRAGWASRCHRCRAARSLPANRCTPPMCGAPAAVWPGAARAGISRAGVASGAVDQGGCRAQAGFVAVVRDARLTLTNAEGLGLVARTPGALDRIEAALAVQWVSGSRPPTRGPWRSRSFWPPGWPVVRWRRWRKRRPWTTRKPGRWTCSWRCHPPPTTPWKPAPPWPNGTRAA